MHAIMLALSLMASTPSPSLPVVSPRLLVGEWQSEQGGTYHFRASGTYSWHGADEGWNGRWRLRYGHTLDLISEDEHNKAMHEFIVIERVVHETLYVRTKYQREVWLKQPGP